jgi:hypothetical protein
MTSGITAAVLVVVAVVLLFILLDKSADAVRDKYLPRLPEGGLLGWLWRRLTGKKRR